MSARIQYEYDEELAKLNKEKVKQRQSKEWKQLELLDLWKREQDKGNVLFGSLLSKYTDLKKKVAHPEILKMINEEIEEVSNISREQLCSYSIGCFIHKISLTEVKPSKSLEVFRDRFPISRTLYNVLKFDIQKKGVIFPILINRDDMEIIDGTTRWLISLELNLISIPCIEITTIGLSELNKLRLLVELWLSSNFAGRQQISRQQSTSLKKYVNMLNRGMLEQRGKLTNGRPTEEELRLVKEYKEKGIEHMDSIDRLLFHLFGLENV